MAYERQYCMICGEEFGEGDAVVELIHKTIVHDRFLFHKSCFDRLFGEDRLRGLAEDLADALGFEWDFAEE